jgi:hypothetical protein
MAARSPDVNPDDTARLYSALAAEADVARPVRVADPRVLVGRIRSGDAQTAVFVNCAAEPIAIDPIVSGVELDLATGGLTLEPFGVAAVPCARTGGGVDEQPAHGAATAVAADEGRDARV